MGRAGPRRQAFRGSGMRTVRRLGTTRRIPSKMRSAKACLAWAAPPVTFFALVAYIFACLSSSDSSGTWMPSLPNSYIEVDLPTPATLLLSSQSGKSGGASLPPANNSSQQTPLTVPPTPDDMTKPNSTESKRCPLRGVPQEHHFEFCCNPDGVGRYTPACRGKFICGDGATISLSRANDGYCDCRDGSDEPGTSACARPHNRFSCIKAEAPPPVAPRVRRAKGDPASRLRAGRLRNQNQKPPSDTEKSSRWTGIWTGFVDDGVCDCVDCEDESLNICEVPCDSDPVLVMA